MPYYAIRLTRDTSESVDLIIKADSRAEAESDALAKPYTEEIDWSQDDNAGDPEITDCFESNKDGKALDDLDDEDEHYESGEALPDPLDHEDVADMER